MLQALTAKEVEYIADCLSNEDLLIKENAGVITNVEPTTSANLLKIFTCTSATLSIAVELLESTSRNCSFITTKLTINHRRD